MYGIVRMEWNGMEGKGVCVCFGWLLCSNFGVDMELERVSGKCGVIRRIKREMWVCRHSHHLSGGVDGYIS